MSFSPITPIYINTTKKYNFKQKISIFANKIQLSVQHSRNMFCCIAEDLFLFQKFFRISTNKYYLKVPHLCTSIYIFAGRNNDSITCLCVLDFRNIQHRRFLQLWVCRNGGRIALLLPLHRHAVSRKCKYFSGHTLYQPTIVNTLFC